MIDPEDLNLYRITDNAQDAVEEITRFYRRYHSSRFVRDQFVIRLKTPLPGELCSDLNDTFADILSDGRFEEHPGPLEGEDGEYPDTPRLVFCYNRRSAGRLRLLINRINEAD